MITMKQARNTHGRLPPPRATFRKWAREEYRRHDPSSLTPKLRQIVFGAPGPKPKSRLEKPTNVNVVEPPKAAKASKKKK